MYFDYMSNGNEFNFRAMGDEFVFDLAPLDQIYADTCGPMIYEFSFVTEDASHKIQMKDD